MRALVGLLISAALASNTAFAEPPAPAAPSSPAPTTARAPATGGKTVEGVTVAGKVFPTKECSPRDAQCINLVVAELKRLYPEQLKRFCFQREMRTIRNNTLFGDSDPEGLQPAQSVTTFNSAAPLSVACASGRR